MGWTVTALGDFCEVIAGQSPEGKYYNDTGDGLPFIRAKRTLAQSLSVSLAHGQHMSRKKLRLATS